MIGLIIGDMLVFGLSAETLAKLSAGKTVLMRGDDLGLPYRIAFLPGVTDASILDQLRSLGVGIPSVDSLPAGTNSVKSEGMTTANIADRVEAMLMAKSGMKLQGHHFTCAACGHTGGNATIVGPERAPTSGDWYLCCKCRTPHILDADLKARAATDEDIAALPSNHRATLETLLTSIKESAERKAAQQPKTALN